MHKLAFIALAGGLTATPALSSPAPEPFPPIPGVQLAQRGCLYPARFYQCIKSGLPRSTCIRIYCIDPDE